MIEMKVDGADAVSVMLTNAPKNIAKRLVDAMTKIGLGFVKHLKEEELSGQRLNTRTGTGRRSVTYRVYDEGGDIVVVAGPDLTKAPYMRAQDLGATITPKSAQNLTIPVGEALTNKGVSRFTARQLIAGPQGYGYVGTFVHNRIIFGKRADGSVVPLFVLKTSVRLKAVGFMAHTLSEKKEWARGLIATAVGEALNDNAGS
jgi:hypothetical protein